MQTGKIDFPMTLEFPKSCFMIEAKLVTLTNVVLNVWIENI